MNSAGSLAGAVDYVVAALRGELATAVAVIAVAVFGMLMLAGRIEVARGGRILIGCALIFGAPTIALALLGAAQPGPASIRGTPVEPAAPPPRPAPPPYDPYAGASVPER